MSRRCSLPVLLLLAGGVSQPFFMGCTPADPTDELFALAANALGQEAHQGRTMVVNPLLLAPENPRMPESALRSLQGQGFEVVGLDGMEDPEKATLYFSPPRAMEDGRFTLNVYVSLGVNRHQTGSLIRGRFKIVAALARVRSDARKLAFWRTQLPLRVTH